MCTASVNKNRQVDFLFVPSNYASNINGVFRKLVIFLPKLVKGFLNITDYVTMQMRAKIWPW